MSSRQSLGILLDTLQCTRQSFPEKNYRAYNIDSTKVEKPCHKGRGNRNEVMIKGHRVK